MLGMSVSSHTSISFGTGFTCNVHVSKEQSHILHDKNIDEFIISDMANDYTKYITILSVILQI